MKVVGVRALQQNASRVLRQLRRGEAVEITDRRRPVAILVPAGQGGVLELLEAAGRLTRGKGDLLALGPPAEGSRRRERASVRLARMRADGR
jgi:antitoxin (DNA-binding transcriptional repressor) of toxin-antitoxin stability system